MRGVSGEDELRINQILAKFNGTWVHKYDLVYAAGYERFRSLYQPHGNRPGRIRLSTVPLCGNDIPVQQHLRQALRLQRQYDDVVGGPAWALRIQTGTVC